MRIYLIFLIISVIMFSLIESKSLYSSYANFRSNKAAMHNRNSQESELPDLRSLHDPNSGRVVPDDAEEVHVQGPDGSIELEKRGIFPVQSSFEPKHSFIDSNTVGIVIDPHTRKTVGILENTGDNWRSDNELTNYFPVDNIYNFKPEMLTARDYGMLSRSAKRYDGQKLRVLDDLDIPVDSMRVAKRNSDFESNSLTKSKLAKKSDYEISQPSVQSLESSDDISESGLKSHENLAKESEVSLVEKPSSVYSEPNNQKELSSEISEEKVDERSEGDMAKRETNPNQNEDEDLESTKIEFKNPVQTPESQNKKRSTENVEAAKLEDVDKSLAQANSFEPANAISAAGSSDKQSMEQESNRVKRQGFKAEGRNFKNIVETPRGFEPDAKLRNKRADEIVKGLANSGDLKVSGNKSPLATSFQTDDDSNNSNIANKIKRMSNDERLDYEKQIEAQIQEKIDSIKEQVKREIAAQKSARESQLSEFSDKKNSAINEEPVYEENQLLHTRRRRNINRLTPFPLVRRKRANAVVPYQQSAFVPYRAEDEDDDEGNEFDDDGFDDRTSNLVRKRQPNVRAQKQSIFEEPASYDYGPLVGYQKREISPEYSAVESQFDPQLERNNANDFLFDYGGSPENFRQKRESYQNLRNRNSLAGYHGGGGALASRSALRRRNFQLAKNVDEDKRYERSNPSGKSLSLADDFFGALPQSYEGELTRLKRVKRADMSALNSTKKG